MVDFDVKGTASLDPDKIIESVEAILTKLDELRDKVDEVDVTIDRLSHKNIDIGVNIDGEDKLVFLRELLDDLDSRDYIVNLKVDINGEDKLEELKLKIDDLDAKDHQVDMKVNLEGADRATAELAALDGELNKKEGDFKKAEKASKDFQFSIMALLPVLTAIIPVLASAGGGIVALAGAFAVMLPGLVGIALAAKPAFTAIQQLTKSLDQNTKNALANASGYNQINSILTKNSAAFRSMSGDMQAVTIGWFQLQNAYSRFQKAVDPAVFPMLSQGLELLRTLLSGLPALVNPAADALQSLILDFENRLHDPVFQSFFNDMKKYMYQFVTDWGTGILNILEGLAALFHAFMPLSVDVSDGFLHMTQSFDKWAQSLSKSKGFQEFLSYVKTNGPVVLDVIKQLAILLAHIGASLSSMGAGSLGIIDHLLQSLNHLAQTNPGLFKLVTNILLLGFAAAKLIPMIAPLIEFLTTPVGAIVGAVVALAVGFDYLYTHSKAFHDWVNANLLPMWNKIVDAGKGFVQWAKSLWPDILKIWREYGPQIIAIVKAVWDFIGNLIQGAVKVIEGIVDVFLGLLTGNWSKVWHGLGQILSGAWQIIWGIIKDGFKVIVAVVQAAGKFLIGLFRDDWNKMTDAVNSALEKLKNFVVNAYHWVVNLLQGWRADIMNAVTNAWDAVNNYFGGIPGRLLKALGDLGSLLYNAGRQVLQGLLNGLKSMWNDVSGFFGSLTSAITSWKGPPSKDAMLLHNNGALIMKSLINGLDSQTSALESHLRGVTKTIASAFGDQYTTSISARLNASLGNADYNLANYQQGGRLPSATGTQMTFAAGSIVVHNPTQEPAGVTLTRVLQGAAKFGTIQAPVGYSTSGR